MANASDYKILTFQRKPGRWRANISPVAEPANRNRGMTTLGFVTSKDSDTEAGAAKAADWAIKELDE